MTGLILAAVPTPQAIDARWLSNVLAERGNDWGITDLRMEPVGTGQLGDTMRIHLQRRSGDGPETIIGKFAAASQDSREAAASNNLYAREIGFYRELAGAARIATADCHGAVLAQDGTFALLLEDCAPARPGDQIVGIDNGQAHAAVIEAARLHAAFWDVDADASRDLSWLESGEPEQRPLAQPFYPADGIRNSWPGYRDRHAEDLSDEVIALCDRFCERYDGYNAIPANRPRCVTHNDYRPDNMLFHADGTLKVVDWQSAALGYAAVDVAYLIGGAFSPDVRRAVEPDLLDAYYAELLQQGVTGYDRADFDEDYRRFTFAGINVAVCAAMSVMRTERGDRLFLTMLQRHAQHVIDTGAFELLG